MIFGENKVCQSELKNDHQIRPLMWVSIMTLLGPGESSIVECLRNSWVYLQCSGEIINGFVELPDPVPKHPSIIVSLEKPWSALQCPSNVLFKSLSAFGILPGIAGSLALELFL